jgi:hypothetical protein
MRIKTVNGRRLIVLHEQKRSKHLEVFSVCVCHFWASFVEIGFVNHLQTLAKRFPSGVNDLLYQFLQKGKNPTSFD